MENLTRLKYDLISGFGFSKANAEEALRMWDNEELNNAENKIFTRFLKNSPFKDPPRGIKETIVNDTILMVLNKLNYRISNG